MRNPDVTVRPRGVMEKCTYCVQRINHGADRRRDREPARRRRRGRDRLPGGLPDRGRSSSATSTTRKARWCKAKACPRNYALLAELNTRPRTTYLAELRNPNPEIEASHENPIEPTITSQAAID